MRGKFSDYSVEDLVIIEEIEDHRSSDGASRVYSDYGSQDLKEVDLILEDLFKMIENNDWQVIARLKDTTVISETSKKEIDDLSQVQILSIKSDYFFEVIDHQSRFTSASLKKKVSKTRNSQNYYQLAEEVQVEVLQLKGS